MYLDIIEILPNGLMTIRFSEELKSLEQLQNEFTNRKKRQLIESFFDIQFAASENACTQIEPKLIDWFVSKFDNEQIQVFLNMTNPVYVSQAKTPDELKIRVMLPPVFRSLKTNVMVKMNFTFTFPMPSMLDPSDTDQLLSLGESSKNSMLLTLVIPFAFMVFMSVSMNRVWSMYLMLQITSNLIHLNLQLPGNAEYITFMTEQISYFKVTEEKNVQYWLKLYVFGNVEWLQQALLGQGTFVLTIEVIVLVVVIIALVEKAKRFPSLTEMIKRKVFWNSIIRGQIQFYFPVCCMVFKSFETFDDLDAQRSVVAVIKFSMLLYLPYFSYNFLMIHYDSLENPEFVAKWGSLYSNLYPLKTSVYKMTTIFCFKRLIYAFVPVFVANSIVPSMYIYTYLPLFSIGYIISMKPMSSRALQFVEILNESTILWCGYFLPIFTDWICDPMLRYRIAWTYISSIVFVASLNLIMILFEMVSVFYKKLRRWIINRRKRTKSVYVPIIRELRLVDNQKK